MAKVSPIWNGRKERTKRTHTSRIVSPWLPPGNEEALPFIARFFLQGPVKGKNCRQDLAVVVARLNILVQVENDLNPRASHGCVIHVSVAMRRRRDRGARMLSLSIHLSLSSLPLLTLFYQIAQSLQRRSFFLTPDVTPLLSLPPCAFPFPCLFLSLGCC